MLFDMREETVLGRVGDVVVEGLGEELIGGGKVLFAVAEEDAGPAGKSGPRRLRHQGRLADAGLTGDQQDLAYPVAGDALGCVGNCLCLDFSSNESNCRPHGQTARERDGDLRIHRSQRFPEHLDGLDRLGQAFQAELAKRAALMAIAATGHQSDDVGSQDLAPFAGGTEPGCLNNGIAEVVAPLPGDLALAQADPQANGEPTFAIIDLRRPVAWRPRRPTPRRRSRTQP